MCEHEFKYTDDWKEKTEFEGETIAIPEVCEKCELEAREIWIFSCHVDNKDGETV